MEARNGSFEKKGETTKTIFQCRLRVSKQLANGSETPDFSAGCRFRSGSLENSNKTAKTRFQCRLRARSGSLDAEKTICQGRLTVSKKFETEKPRFQSRLRARQLPLEAKRATVNRQISVQVEAFEMIG